MKSRAHIRRHPIHPMLIPFPIAFLIGGLSADVAGRLLDLPDLFTVAWYLLPAGVLMGFVAGVPGFIDYRATVPPRSSARKRAVLHMSVNIMALLIFLLAWWLRGEAGLSPEGVLIGMEMIGAGLLGAGGWMGGTLVHRNQIGVDRRQPGATRWTEGRYGHSGPVRVADIDELATDQMKLLHIGKRRIVLARTDTGYLAFDDRCTHRGASLSDGVLACGTVTCPWHGSRFDARTGAPVIGPATESLATHDAEPRGDGIYLVLGE